MSKICGTNYSNPLFEEKSACSRSKVAFVASLVGTAAGIAFVILASLQFFGTVGSAPFITAIIASSFVTLISSGPLVWVLIDSCKRLHQNAQETPTLPDELS